MLFACILAGSDFNVKTGLFRAMATQPELSEKPVARRIGELQNLRCPGISSVKLPPQSIPSAGAHIF
jgi:hypothetical protein